jgi:hypothetical protein
MSGAAQLQTRWGGFVDARLRATGAFRVEQIDGVWWLVDPDGGRCLSKGVTTVRFDQDRVQHGERIPYAEACARKYGGVETWREAAANRLLAWGFNSLGAWSDDALAQAGARPLALAPVLHLGSVFMARQDASFGRDPHRIFPDVFDPAFARFARNRAEDLCTRWRDDAAVIGWFSDNELQWGPDWRGSTELLTAFLNLPPATPGRVAAIDLLRQRHAGFAGFNTVWGTTATSWEELSALPHIAAAWRPETAARVGGQAISAAVAADCEAFAALLADRYFAAVVAAIRAADDVHMMLGCRFGRAPAPAVIATAGRRLDILSFNCYEADPTPALDAYARGGRPCLIGEFSFRGDDAGLPNTHGGGVRVPTQADRAVAFTRYVSTALRRPELLGYHWFEHADQPAEGRFDGENSNYGIVDIADEPYETLAAAMTALNGRADAIHLAASGTDRLG